MELKYRRTINIQIGQKFYGLIAPSLWTYDGIYPIEVHRIDWNNMRVIFKVDQPCQFVSCSFKEFSRYVYESEAEGENVRKSLRYDEGMIKCPV